MSTPNTEEGTGAGPTDLAVVIVFGAMIGWLGAWTLLTFRPPREPHA